MDVSVEDGSIEDAKTMLMTELATLIDDFDENFLPAAEEEPEPEPEEDDGKVSKEDLLKQGGQKPEMPTS